MGQPSAAPARSGIPRPAGPGVPHVVPLCDGHTARIRERQRLLGSSGGEQDAWTEDGRHGGHDSDDPWRRSAGMLV